MTKHTDEELIAIAKAATEGEWLHLDEGDRQIVAFAEGIQPFIAKLIGPFTDAKRRSNGKFIATFNPAFVLSLIERAQGAERDRDDFRERLSVACEQWEAAEARARTAVEALKALRTQADNAAWNAHRSGITFDNAQLVRIFEGMVEQADAALNAKKGSDQ
ncbi:hypothetical protein [Caulobacter sp. UC70_42]|uniref:hypothetical protein n=1 Tax=Caulobacter sp. UC70_42 TaxID=3374551 RepID=UPI003758328F